MARSRTLRRRIVAALLVLVLGTACAGEAPPPVARPPRNVLMIVVDDLRPELGAYGGAGSATPRLDALAARSLVLERAFCSLASCAPSRAALLTGLRPDRNGVLDLNTHFRTAAPQAITMPELFRRQGWHTAALGKVHHGPPEGSAGTDLDDPPSWSVPCWRPSRWQTWYASETTRARREELLRAATDAAEARGEKLWAEPKGPAFESAPVADDEYPDGMIALEALRRLGERAREPDTPFFLAVGFLKPHLPFVAPERYFALHPLEEIVLPPPGRPEAPACAFTNSDEVRAHDGVPLEGPIDPALQREFIRAYRACVSFVDAQIGRLLDELERLGLAEDTVVVVLGDHGWHLGEQELFGKHTNYEVAARVPLLVHVPGRPAARSQALVELIDVYPTLAELCALEPPADLDGASFAALFEQPTRAGKPAVFHQYPRKFPGGGTADGRAIRTARWRFVEWRDRQGRTIGEELYDLQRDPHERENLAADPLRAELRADLAARLAAQTASGRR